MSLVKSQSYRFESITVKVDNIQYPCDQCECAMLVIDTFSVISLDGYA